MATRLGIELTATRWRMVELNGRRSWHPGGPESVVRSSADVSADEGAAAFAPFAGRAASVVVWGVPNRHRQAIVDCGAYEAMHEEARAALDAAGMAMAGAWTDIAPAGPVRGRSRRPVIVTIAPAAAMRAAIRPLVTAGVRVRAVMTPAAALAAIARSRGALAAPDALEIYVALEETETCLALLRGGHLIAARDIAWGYRGEHHVESETARRGAVAQRLGDEVVEFFDALGEPMSSIHQICICGGAPDLRSTAVPLMERFDVEVEPLDSLYAIDPRRLTSNDRFREQIAAWRMAWAAAAEWPPAMNLLRPMRRRQSHVWLSRAAVLAGVAVGVGAGVSVAESALPPIRASVAAPRPRVPASEPARRRRLIPQPPAGAKIARAFPALRQEPPAFVRHEMPTIRREPDPLPEPEPPAVSRPAANARVSSQAAPAPIDAVVETILYSAERQLAIVDGRIVARGDRVRDAVVAEITPAAVVVKDSGGRLVRLAARSGGLQ